jgi:hypothetical protein
MTSAGEPPAPTALDVRDDAAVAAIRLPAELWSDIRIRFLSELAKRGRPEEVCSRIRAS